MGSPTVSVLRGSTTEEIGIRSVEEDCAEFVETPSSRNRSARGMVTGVLLGAGLWGVILVATGFIKL